MANFSNLITTAKGHGFIVKILAGKLAAEPKAPFTRIVTSSAVYQLSQLEALTDLAEIRQETLVSAVAKQNQTTIMIHGGVDNSKLVTGYRLNTVGVYFIDPDDSQEYLFGAAVHLPTPDEPNSDFIFPFNGLTTTGLLFDLVASVGNADNISFNVDPAAVVTIKTLEIHNTSARAHENRFAELSTRFTEMSGAPAPNTGVRTHFKTTEDATGYKPVAPSDRFNGAKIAETRIEGNPNDIGKSRYDVALPITAVQAVFDKDTGVDLVTYLRKLIWDEIRRTAPDGEPVLIGYDPVADQIFGFPLSRISTIAPRISGGDPSMQVSDYPNGQIDGGNPSMQISDYQDGQIDGGDPFTL